MTATRTQTITHTIWARSESEAHELQSLGWKLGQDQTRPVHHNTWALLLVWEGDSEPPMPADESLQAERVGQ